jgi:ethanolamine utilization protein EutQ (cupin superfamily)
MPSITANRSDEGDFHQLVVDDAAVGEVKLTRHRTEHGVFMFAGVYRSAEPIDTEFVAEFDEAMYVIDGSIVFRTEDGSIRVDAGGYATIPKGLSCPIEQSASFKAFVVTFP